MNSYECMIIVKPDLGKEDADKLLAHIKDIIAKNKGSIDDVKELGKQRMSYYIKKYAEGFYYLVCFHADASGIDKMKKAFALSEAILRVLIVKI